MTPLGPSLLLLLTPPSARRSCSSLLLQPMWMAPEIIMGRRYTERADVYAYGIILWEILTRLEPYEEKEPMQIVVEVVNDGLRPTLPAEFAESPLVPLMKDWSENDAMRTCCRTERRGRRGSGPGPAGRTPCVLGAAAPG